MVFSKTQGFPLSADWHVNRGRLHVQVALFLLRWAQLSRKWPSPARQLVSIPVGLLYRFVSLALIGFDIPISTQIGPGLTIQHGVGLVVHNRAVIGAGVTLRQCTTIGSKDGSNPPTIADGVSVGPNCVILGPISIGSYAQIGAGSVVLADVGESEVHAGNPARRLR